MRARDSAVEHSDDPLRAVVREELGNLGDWAGRGPSYTSILSAPSSPIGSGTVIPPRHKTNLGLLQLPRLGGRWPIPGAGRAGLLVAATAVAVMLGASLWFVASRLDDRHIQSINVGPDTDATTETTVSDDVASRSSNSMADSAAEDGLDAGRGDGEDGAAPGPDFNADADSAVGPSADLAEFARRLGAETVIASVDSQFATGGIVVWADGVARNLESIPAGSQIETNGEVLFDVYVDNTTATETMVWDLNGNPVDCLGIADMRRNEDGSWFGFLELEEDVGFRPDRAPSGQWPDPVDLGGSATVDWWSSQIERVDCETHDSTLVEGNRGFFVPSVEYWLMLDHVAGRRFVVGTGEAGRHDRMVDERGQVIVDDGEGLHRWVFSEDGSVVYFTTWSGLLVARSTVSGETLWSNPLPDGPVSRIWWLGDRVVVDVTEVGVSTRYLVYGATDGRALGQPVTTDLFVLHID